MDKKEENYHKIQQQETLLQEKGESLAKAKEEYRKMLIDEAIADILTVIKEENELTEKDLKIFLGDLSFRTKRLYSK